jgi:hypothetical protein
MSRKQKDEFVGSIMIIIGAIIVAVVLISFALGFNPFK